MRKTIGFTALLGCLVFFSAATHAQEALSGVRKVKDIVIYEDAPFFSAFPSIIRKPDGELLLAFRRAPNRRALGEQKNEHVDPNSYLVQVSSRDGTHWTQQPKLIHANPFGGSQDPCLLQLSDGSILCMSYGWTFVRPDGLTRLKSPFLENFPGSIFNGGHYVRSTDGGATWGGPFQPPHIEPEILNDPFGEPITAYNRGALVEGRDGRVFWACAATDQDAPRKTSAHLLVSDDIVQRNVFVRDAGRRPGGVFAFRKTERCGVYCAIDGWREELRTLERNGISRASVARFAAAGQSGVVNLRIPARALGSPRSYSQCGVHRLCHGAGDNPAGRWRDE